MKHPIEGILFAIFAAFTLSLMGLFVKLAANVNNLSLVFFRNLISFMILVPFLFRKGFSLKSKRLPLLFMRSACGLLGIYAYFYTLKHLELTNSILLLNTMPLFIPLVLFIWTRHKIPAKRVYSLALGFLGVLFILKPASGLLNFVTLVGLLGAMSGATALVALRKLSKTEPARLIMFYNFAACILISFFPMVSDYEPIESGWIFVILVGVTAVIYQMFLTLAYKHIPATQAGCLLYLAVIFGGFFDWMVWGNIPDLYTIIGTVLVIAGGTWTLLESKRFPS